MATQTAVGLDRIAQGGDEVVRILNLATDHGVVDHELVWA